MTKVDTSTAAVHAALNGVTDGPWVVGDPKIGRAVWHREFQVANTHGMSRNFDWEEWQAQQDANARFIAWCREGVPALLAELDDLKLAVRHAVDHADGAMSDRTMLMNALDGMLIALSTGKGIAEATDNAKAAMRRATQGGAQ